MLYKESFTKAWASVAQEMKKKLKTEKATDTTLFDAWYKMVDKRACSKIGEALGALDKAVPKELKNPTEKEYTAFKDALIKTKIGCNTELEAIVGLVKELKGGDEKLKEEKKNSCYRVLKVFKANIEHCLATAQAQAGEIRIAMGKNDLDKETIIKHKSMKLLTEHAVLVKQLLANPVDLKLRQAHASLRYALETIQDLVADGPEKRRHAITSLIQNLNQIKYTSIDDPMAAEAVKTAASALGKVIKTTVGVL